MMAYQTMVEGAIEKAIGWFDSHKTSVGWHIPVVSEDPISTAFSLNLVADGRRGHIIDYLASRKVWRVSGYAARLAVIGLVRSGDLRGAREFIASCEEDSRRAPFSGSSRLVGELKHSGRESLRRDAVIRLFYESLLHLVPASGWYSRESLIYDYLPDIASEMAGSSKSSKLHTVLLASLNEDGSHGGITFDTMRAAYFLKCMGDTESFEKTMGWINGVYNTNGSFAALVGLDVYDTAVVGIALREAGVSVNPSVLDWLESTRIGDGYPWFSKSYHPDNEDTALVLLLKKFTSYEEGQKDNLRFLLRGQNPDGGWGYIPLPILSYALPSKLAFELLNEPYWSSQRARNVLGMLGVRRNHVSTVDLTGRILVTLSEFREDPEVKRAIAAGVDFLRRWFSVGRFSIPFRWYDTDFVESGLTCVALGLLGALPKETSLALDRLQKTPPAAPDEAAHLLWAMAEGGLNSQSMQKVVDFIVGGQKQDGSWDPSIRFYIVPGRYMDPPFSAAVCLLALAKYRRLLR